MLPRPRITACVVDFCFVRGFVRGQLLGGGWCVSERRMSGVMFAEDRLTMYSETTPSFPHGFCFLSGRGLIPDRFPR